LQFQNDDLPHNLQDPPPSDSEAGNTSGEEQEEEEEGPITSTPGTPSARKAAASIFMRVNRPTDAKPHPSFPGYYFARSSTPQEEQAAASHPGVACSIAFRTEILKQAVYGPVAVHKLEQNAIAVRTITARLNHLVTEQAATSAVTIQLLEAVHKFLADKPACQNLLASAVMAERKFDMDTPEFKAFYRRLRMEMVPLERAKDPVRLPFEDPKVLHKFLQEKTSPLWDGERYFGARSELRRAALWKHLDRKLQGLTKHTTSHLVVTTMLSLFTKSYLCNFSWSTKGSQAKRWIKITPIHVCEWVERFLLYECRKFSIPVTKFEIVKQLRKKLSNCKGDWRAICTKSGRPDGAPRLLLWPRPAHSKEAEQIDDLSSSEADTGSIQSPPPLLSRAGSEAAQSAEEAAESGDEAAEPGEEDAQSGEEEAQSGEDAEAEPDDSVGTEDVTINLDSSTPGKEGEEEESGEEEEEEEEDGGESVDAVPEDDYEEGGDLQEDLEFGDSDAEGGE
jgi:hypothetical protein